MRMEAFADRFQQLGSCVQVGLGPGQGSMAEIRRERGQFGEEVGPATMPRQEAIHAKRVSGIVDARPANSPRSADPELAENRQKEVGKAVVGQLAPGKRNEERGSGPRNISVPTRLLKPFIFIRVIMFGVFKTL